MFSRYKSFDTFLIKINCEDGVTLFYSKERLYDNLTLFKDFIDETNLNVINLNFDSRIVSIFLNYCDTLSINIKECSISDLIELCLFADYIGMKRDNCVLHDFEIMDEIYEYYKPKDSDYLYNIYGYTFKGCIEFLKTL